MSALWIEGEQLKYKDTFLLVFFYGMFECVEDVTFLSFYVNFKRHHMTITKIQQRSSFGEIALQLNDAVYYSLFWKKNVSFRKFRLGIVSTNIFMISCLDIMDIGVVVDSVSNNCQLCSSLNVKQSLAKPKNYFPSKKTFFFHKYISFRGYETLFPLLPEQKFNEQSKSLSWYKDMNSQ